MKFKPEFNKYFWHACHVDGIDCYYLKEDFECWVNGGKSVIRALSVDRNNGEITHVHDEERGKLEASPGMELSIYKLSIKHVETFR